VKTLIHLSDLHFDRVDRGVVEALAGTVKEMAPDLIAVSGDLTQRARSHQFIEARAFLDSLPPPILVVPGNHDVPFHNVFARFFNPLGGYRRHITADLHPHHADGELMVVGTNTTRSLTIGGGGIRRRELQRICEMLNRVDEPVIKVVVGHHPFDVPDAGAAIGRTRLPGLDAVERLAQAGVDLFLTGHLHVTYAGPTATRYKVGGRSAIVVEAGTATSTRVRGEPNAFNVLRVDPTAIVVEHLVWRSDSRAFAASEVQRFRRTPEGWATG
jgi:3',5'-cyclic AMP phosphodiesterase CpdA